MGSKNFIAVKDILQVINEKDTSKFRNILNNIDSHLDTIIDSNGQTLLHYAVMSSPKIIEELLDKGSDPDSMDSDEWTPLLLAAKNGKAEACELLLKHGAQIDHKDMGGWTPLMWACYKGREDVVKVLLKYHAETQLREEHGMTPIIWAAGRGYANIVEDLINAGAKAQSVDKFNSSALLWACRRGFKDCAIHLLNAGASIDTVGMNGWTALLAASRGGYVKLVNLLLLYSPNVNHRDKDGMTAISLASEKGFDEIVRILLSKGANGSCPNFLNDTPLILACKNGHYAVAKMLLANNIGTNAQGHNGKTALYHAVEKNFNDVVMLLLRNKSDTEIPSEDGERPLHRAIHNRNSVEVQMLLDAGVDVSKPDKKGDTALHIAVRMRSKHLTEMLLRNPKNSKILYTPNHMGQTPYNIDAQTGHPYLPYLFGAQHLKSFDYTENMLGYDLYSSALADVFCDPMLGLPLSVGLYAKWGSGKSFLLKKLQDEMKSFTDHFQSPTFILTTFVSFMTIIFCIFPVIFISIAVSWEYGLIALIGFLAIFYTFYGIVIMANYFNWPRASIFNEFLAQKFSKLKLFFQIIYCNPFTRTTEEIVPIGVRFLFTDYLKLTIMGGEMSIAGMIATLCEAAENEFGLLTVRFYRVFHPKINDKRRTKTCFFIPKYLVTMFTGICIVSLLALIVKHFIVEKSGKLKTDSLDFKIMIGLGCFIFFALLSNIVIWKRLLQFSFSSQAHRIFHSADNVDTNKAEVFMQKIKEEVNHLVDLVKTIDLFTNRHTRLVVIIDGLDSCEQEKVLQILEAVKTLFSDSKAPFITILAIDPHIIIRAIESNLNSAFQRSAIKGYDYLRNTVNLPIFLQRQGLLQFCAGKNADLRFRNIYKKAMYSSNLGLSTTSIKGIGKPCLKGNLLPMQSGLTNSGGVGGLPNGPRASFTESVSSNVGTEKPPTFKGSSMFALTNAENTDLRKVFTNDHYFSDVNPRSLRRLTNIVYVAGRLMKAFSLDFQWVRLATWINLIEQWPYRSSWIILYYEENEHWIDSNLTLKQIYDIVAPFIPTSREIEPFLEYDKNDLKLVYMLSGASVKLMVADMKLFLPFSVNLDPYIKKVIREHIGDLLKCKSGSLNNAINHQDMVLVAKDQYESKTSPLPMLTFDDRNLIHPYDLTKKEDDEQHAVMMPTDKNATSNRLNSQTQRMISSMFKNLKINKSPDALTATEIADLLTLIPDWGNNAKSDVEKYRNLILENNISGFVLLTCDKKELQNVLPMNFGDWHIFLGFILYLRSLSNVVKIVPPEDLIERTTKLPAEEMESPVNLQRHFSQMAMSHLEKEVEQEHELLSAAISKFEENDLKMSESDIEDYEDLKSKEMPSVNFSARGTLSKNIPYQKLKNATARKPQQSVIVEGEILDTSNISTNHPPDRDRKKSNRIFDKGEHVGKVEGEFSVLNSLPTSENFPLLNYEQKPDGGGGDGDLQSENLRFSFPAEEEVYGRHENFQEFPEEPTPTPSPNPRTRPTPRFDGGGYRKSSVISSQLQNVHDILESTMKRNDSMSSKLSQGTGKNFVVTSVAEPQSIDETKTATLAAPSYRSISSRQPSIQQLEDAQETELKEQEENVKRKIEMNETRPDYASLDYCPRSVMHLERKSSKIRQGLERLAAGRKSSTAMPNVIPAARDLLNSVMGNTATHHSSIAGGSSFSKRGKGSFVGAGENLGSIAGAQINQPINTDLVFPAEPFIYTSSSSSSSSTSSSSAAMRANQKSIDGSNENPITVTTTTPITLSLNNTITPTSPISYNNDNSPPEKGEAPSP